MSFEEYVVTNGAELVRFARLLTGDEHRGEDLAQDVLARAYVRWKQVARAEHPDRYVRRMLINANNSWWRRRASREVNVPAVADRPTNHDLGADAVERDAVWQLIVSLPARQRAVLVLRYYSDLDDMAIAEILGCSTVTIRTHAMRAVAKLRRQFAEFDEARPTGRRQ